MEYERADDRASHPTPPESPPQPPQSSHPLPPTPPQSATPRPSNAIKEGSPAVETVLQLLRDHRAGKLTKGITPEVELDISGYQTVLHRLDEDSDFKGYVEDKVRFEYSSIDNIFRLRMPTSTHEVLCGNVTEEILLQLQHIRRRDDDDGRFASAIRNCESSTIFLIEFEAHEEGKFIRRDPDKQFQHKGAAYPSLIIEVSYTQKRKDVSKLAEEYILYSNGDIKAVIGLDMDYGAAKEARIAVWEPHYTIEEGDDIETLSIKESVPWQLFRDAEGNATNPEKELILPLDFFAPSCIRAYNPSSPKITIKYAKLTNFLNEAEEFDAIRTKKMKESLGKKSTVQRKKRKRAPTPPEELSSDAEHVHAER